MSCRPGCAACCIAPSISSPIPGMPGGKPAGTPCIQLTEDLRCGIFGQQASEEMCGNSRDQALIWLTRMEDMTKPDTLLIDSMK